MRQIKARSKWVRSSPRKIQRVAELIAGKKASEALNILKFLPQKGARILEKVVKSAIANAKNNFKMNESELIVKEAYANKGITLKRFHPRARGRAFPIKKRTSHITVNLVGKEA